MKNIRRKIEVLSPDVANKIAAGEVVERPSAVVKELVENSLDAKANRIVVEIENGGRKLIRVSDDGTGMNREDAKLSVQRHATSKVRTAKDIDTIRTLGFRGEALPSIAAVSNFELVTCDRASEEATKVQIDGGLNTKVTEAGRGPGTTISVKNLFYCVPARAKFLKTTATELSHIGRFIYSISLAWPNVGFKYVIDGNERFSLPPQLETVPFSDALKNRLIQLRGDEFAESLIPINYSFEEYSVTGFITNWTKNVLTKQEFYFFVNDRPVYCRWLASVVKRAYGSLLSREYFPYVFIFLNLNPEAVDVNIHPAKREVRFGKEFAVQSAISTAIMNALKTRSSAPSVEFSNLSAPETRGGSANTSSSKVFKPSNIREPGTNRLTVEEWKKLYGKKNNKTKEEAEPSIKIKRTEEKPAGKFVGSEDEIRALGQAAGAYIIAEISGVRNGLVLVDQHAAHERINFDIFLKSMETEISTKQALLLPVTVQLTSEQSAIITENLTELCNAGFGIENFGKDIFKIDAVPTNVETGDLESLLIDISNDFLESGKSTRVEELRKKLALLLVCRNSIKFNQILSIKEMQALVEQLLATTTPWTCPHGRPTMIVLPFDEIEKRFGR